MDGLQRFHPRSLFVCVILVLFALGTAAGLDWDWQFPNNSPN